MTDGIKWEEITDKSKIPWGQQTLLVTPAPGAKPYKMKISDFNPSNVSCDPCGGWRPKGSRDAWKDLVNDKSRTARLRKFVIQQKIAERKIRRQEQKRISKASTKASSAKKKANKKVKKALKTPPRSTKPASTRSANTISTFDTPTSTLSNATSEPQIVPKFGIRGCRVGGGAYSLPVVYNGLDQAVIPNDDWTNMKSLMSDAGGLLKLSAVAQATTQKQLSQHIQQQQEWNRNTTERQDAFDMRLRELERKK